MIVSLAGVGLQARAAAALILAGLLTAEAGACGRDSDCAIGDRSYRIALPDGQDGTKPRGAIIFAHGFGGSAEQMMGNDSLVGMAGDLGLALVAAQAVGPEWNIPHIPSVDAQEGVDELAYFHSLADEVASRFGIDRSAIVAAGFSSGAMMVWQLACQGGGDFAGFVPMSGTMWRPLPEICPGAPVNLIHYHGTEDTVVPLDGRVVKDAHQGDVREALALITRDGSYHPVSADDSPGLSCERQVDDRGHLVELCLFAGGHSFSPAHLARAARIFLPD